MSSPRPPRSMVSRMMVSSNASVFDATPRASGAMPTEVWPKAEQGGPVGTSTSSQCKSRHSPGR
eukprot:8928341-Lingulodinium_polyedra.AAC.1